MLGVGKKKFELLAKEFGSIKNISNADKKEFKKIKGIGKYTSENVKASLDSDIFI